MTWFEREYRLRLVPRGSDKRKRQLRELDDLIEKEKKEKGED